MAFDNSRKKPDNEKKQMPRAQEERTKPKQPPDRKDAQPNNAHSAPPMQEDADVNQMMRRQSAPRPTAQDAAEQLYGQQQGMNAEGAMDGMVALTQTIGVKEIQKARQVLMKYKQGKKNLEQKVIDSEQWYKLRSWECMRKESKEKDQVEPVSGWLFNSIANKHATMMDNFPSPNILPREEADKAEAKMLSSIVPVVLEQNNFEEAYDMETEDKLKGGTGIFGVFWDDSKLNGLGDISVECVDVLSLFWEPGIRDIQKSRNLFHVDLVDNDLLAEEYPQLAGKLGSSTLDVSQYIYDDTVDTTEKSAVVDWYYKKRVGRKTILHYCKFVNDTVLFASENEPNMAKRGWYDHGSYPYVFDPLFRMKGTPCGFGFVDVAKSPQEYIDRGNQAIMENMLANAKPRHFVRIDGSINEEEYLDLSNPLVHVDGNLGQDSIMPIQGKTLNNTYVQVVHDKVDELKETTGNRDVANGGTTSGVTAASAIAAMQEASSRLDRRSAKATYRAYRKVVVMVIELIRQFYDLPRFFRILGQNGAEEYISFSNAGLKPHHQGVEMGVDMGYRVPLFDIEVTAQKQSPYSKMAQNEMALQFYQSGFFNPQLADQSLACLEMMDFDRKNFIMQRIAQNGGMYQQMMLMQQQMVMMAQRLDQLEGTNLAGAMMGQSAQETPKEEGRAPEKKNSTGGESSVTKNARQRVAASSAPT